MKKACFLALISIFTVIFYSGTAMTEDSVNSSEKTTGTKEQTTTPNTPGIEQIYRLIPQLGDADWEIREEAQNKLRTFGKALIEQYRLDKLKDADGKSTAQSKKAAEDFAHALSEALADKDVEIRMRANYLRGYFYRYTRPKIMYQAGGELRLLFPDGGNEESLLKDGFNNGRPCWSPDGSRIAFESNRKGNWDIYTVDIDGNNLKQLTDNNADDRFPAWSPDGKQIAFDSTRDGNTEIYIMDTDGKNQKRLTENQVEDGWASWSPDGKQIAFESGTANNRDIYAISADGKNLKQLTENSRYDGDPAWSPDGKKIAFNLNMDGQNNWEIHIMDAEDGKNQQRLTENQVLNGWASWSPDGKQIAFVSNRNGMINEIYIMDADGANQKKVSAGAGESPEWCPAAFPELSKLFTQLESKKNK
ncbi:MAG: PD40 domain-containing protein [Planctomycetes bacterium]|nr:PD40 domain-containing protein [Planctomycetota bacterium]